MSRITGIYRLNDERLAVLDKPELFSSAQLALENALASMIDDPAVLKSLHKKSIKVSSLNEFAKILDEVLEEE